MKKKIAVIFTMVIMSLSISTAYAENKSIIEKNNDILLKLANYYVQNNSNKEDEVTEKDKLIDEYCSIKSEKEAIDIDEEILKSNYSLKKISWNDYSAELSKLKLKENELDLKEDNIKIQLKKIKLDEQKKKTLQNKSNEEINNLKAELKKLDLKEDENDLNKNNIKYKYKMSQITRDAFIKEMKNLEKIDYDIESQKDELKYQLGYDIDDDIDDYEKNFDSIIGTGDLNSLLTQLREIEIKKDELDLKEDKLKLQYKNGEITLDSYKQQKAQLERDEDKLDNLEDIIEDKLEIMGYDD